jgi:hypothetical protein
MRRPRSAGAIVPSALPGPGTLGGSAPDACGVRGTSAVLRAIFCLPSFPGTKKTAPERHFRAVRSGFSPEENLFFLPIFLDDTIIAHFLLHVNGADAPILRQLFSRLRHGACAFAPHWAPAGDKALRKGGPERQWLGMHRRGCGNAIFAVERHAMACCAWF